jgi:hypothetical protein
MTLSSITSTHPVPRPSSPRLEGYGPVRTPSTIQSKSLQRAIVVGAAVAAVAVLGVASLIAIADGGEPHVRPSRLSPPRPSPVAASS